MYLHYWFTLNFMYSVYFTFCMWYLCFLMFLSIQIPAQNTTVHINRIVSQSLFQSLWTPLTAIDQVTSKHCCHLSESICHQLRLYLCFLHETQAFLVYLPVIAQHSYIDFHSINCIYETSIFFFHQFKRNLAILNGIEIMAYSCRKSILPRGNRTKTCFTANISLHIYHTLIHTKVTWPGYQKISNVHIALRFDTN